MADKWDELNKEFLFYLLPILSSLEGVGESKEFKKFNSQIPTVENETKVYINSKICDMSRP